MTPLTRTQRTSESDLANCHVFRMATNRLITIAIITVLVLLIFAVIYSKFH